MLQLLSPGRIGAPTAATELEDKAAHAGNDFSDYFRQHKIYFDEGICKHLEKFDNDMRISRFTYLFNPTTGEGGVDRWEKRHKAWESLNQQVPTIRKEIEHTFRQLLGLTFQEYQGILPKGK